MFHVQGPHRIVRCVPCLHDGFGPAIVPPSKTRCGRFEARYCFVDKDGTVAALDERVGVVGHAAKEVMRGHGSRLDRL